MIKLLIFDHDMTIVDSSLAIMTGVNMVAEAIGRPGVTRETMLKFAAVPLRDFFRGIWGESREEWVAIYQEKIEPVEHTLIHPFPEVPQVLAKLREMGFFLAVASNRRYPRAAMDKNGLSAYFDEIIGCVDGLPPKPDPAMLKHLMERFGVTSAETIYVGDSDIDMETGLAAGVLCVGAAKGNFTKEQLEKLGAWRVVDSLDGLLPLLEDAAREHAAHERECYSAG